MILSMTKVLSRSKINASKERDGQNPNFMLSFRFIWPVWECGSQLTWFLFAHSKMLRLCGLAPIELWSELWMKLCKLEAAQLNLIKRAIDRFHFSQGPRHFGNCNSCSAGWSLLSCLLTTQVLAEFNLLCVPSPL